MLFGMWNHLVDFYKVCSNYIPVAKNDPAPRGEGDEMFYIGLYKENVMNYSCLKPQGLEP